LGVKSKEVEMAGLKVETGGAIDVNGYVNIVDNILGDPTSNIDAIFDELADYSSEEVIDFLNDNNRTVTYDNGKPLTKKKARVVVSYDDEKTKRGKRRFVINLPKDNPLDNGGDLSYLDNYITALNGIANQVKKRKFLFGVMLLTRCR